MSVEKAIELLKKDGKPIEIVESINKNSIESGASAICGACGACGDWGNCGTER